MLGTWEPKNQREGNYGETEILGTWGLDRDQKTKRENYRDPGYLGTR